MADELNRKQGIMSGARGEDEPAELDRSLRPTSTAEFVGQQSRALAKDTGRFFG